MPSPALALSRCRVTTNRGPVRLEAVIGRAGQEEARLQVAAAQKTMRRVAPQAIRQTEHTLRGQETGLREALDN
jgi:hypothetical protein